MRTYLDKSADSRRVNCPETKSWPLGHALWLDVLCLALWAAGPGASAETPPGLDLQLYAGLTITGAVGTVYSVEYVTDLAQTNNASAWRCLEFLQLPASPYLWADKSAPATGRRFYRASIFAAPTNLVFIPPGTFRMGSPTNEVDRSDSEGPQTAVTITRGFWMGKYEVTQEEYLAVMGNNPSDYTGDTNRPGLPATFMSWLDATDYCAALTQRERSAGRIRTNAVYRLPTEAEWEYACRAWTSTRFSFGDDPVYTNLTNYAWHLGRPDPGLHPVGQKLPNPWGLYDMHGNVMEWCQDWYGEYPGGIAVDPQGPAMGSDHVVRGGDGLYWPDDASGCRSASRRPYGVHWWPHPVGCRVVLAPQVSPEQNDERSGSEQAGRSDGGPELPLCRETLSIEGEDNRVSQAAPLSRSGAMKLTSDESLTEKARELRGRRARWHGRNRQSTRLLVGRNDCGFGLEPSSRRHDGNAVDTLKPG